MAVEGASCVSDGLIFLIAKFQLERMLSLSEPQGPRVAAKQSNDLLQSLSTGGDGMELRLSTPVRLRGAEMVHVSL